MAHLALIGSHTVNGVAAIHSKIIKETIFRDFVQFYGEEKFQNKTNGITPRRWLRQANPELAKLITSTLGSDDWIQNLDNLKGLEKFIDDEHFLRRWADIKYNNKAQLAKYIRQTVGISINPNSLFDIQVKRIHEYKRQLMNILGVIHRYYRLKLMNEEQRERVVARTVIFGGKAAPGYFVAKSVIKLINSVAEVINDDEETSRYLKVVFVPDYNVSQAELLVPASDISQHISTAGTEASGTSNMKFVLNGGIILGTVDGANIEIAEEIGDENIFLFGLKADQVPMVRHETRYRNTAMNEDLRTVLDWIKEGVFGSPGIFESVINTLTVGGDYYLVSADFAEYLKAQDRVDTAFRNEHLWTQMSVRCTARMGKFSSDRAIQEYAKDIWKVKPCPVGSVDTNGDEESATHSVEVEGNTSTSTSGSGKVEVMKEKDTISIPSGPSGKA